MPSQARQEDQFPPKDGLVIRFDRYQADVRSGELRKEGRKIRLQAQPFQLLVLLLRNPGRVVTREDVRRELWPGDTFVDFDHGLAAAVNKIRESLCDSAETPKFIETLPRRGYRFIGKVEPDPPVEIRVRLEEVPGRDAQPEVVAPSRAADKNLADPQPSRTRGWAFGAALILLGAGIAAAIFLLLREKPLEARTQQWNVSQFTSYRGTAAAPAFSPDGSRIAFGWDAGKPKNQDLYVKALGGEALLQLTHHPSEWISAAWAPDGTQIAFLRVAGADTGLYVVPALGGPEQKLRATSTPYDLAAPISWSPDGKWIAYAELAEGTTQNRNFLFSMDTRESHLFYHDPACTHEGNLTFSNDGNRMAWFCVRKLDAIDLLVGDPAGRSRRLVTTVQSPPYGLTWTADDSKVILPQSGPDRSELFEVNLSDGTMQRTAAGAGQSAAIWPAISAKTSSMAWDAYRYHVDLVRKDLKDPARRPEPFVESSRNEDQASYSPDGKHVVFDSDRSGIWSVWIGDADGSNLTQVSRGGVAGFPRWSPDSRRVVYQQWDQPTQSVYFADVDERTPHKLVTVSDDVGSPFWSPDGQWIYFEDDGSFLRKFYRCSLACNKNETLVRDGPKALSMQMSDDGKYWYCVHAEGEAKVFRETMTNGRVQGEEEVAGIPQLAGYFSSFKVARNGIYFVSADKPNTLAYFDFTTQKTRELFTAEKAIENGFWVSNDGRYALVAQSSDNHQDIMIAEPKR